jgi:hypothetical protein
MMEWNIPWDTVKRETPINKKSVITLDAKKVIFAVGVTIPVRTNYEPHKVEDMPYFFAAACLHYGLECPSFKDKWRR